jgi:hypothetical protein
MKGVYCVLSLGTKDVIWNKATPLKIQLFAWRLLNNRILAKDYLTLQKFLDANSLLCRLWAKGNNESLIF